MKYTQAIFLVFLFLLMYPPVAEACTCRGRPQGVKGIQTCSYYWQSETVFVGLAEKVEIDQKLGSMKVTFLVERPIRGVIDKIVEVFTSSSTASCGYPFKQGERYFVYGRKASDGRLREGLCGPTTLVENADDDFEYADLIAAGNIGTRIFGIVQEDRQPTTDDRRTLEPVSNVEVRIKGEKTKKEFRAYTDRSGKYLFSEIPPDLYRLTAKFPGIWREIQSPARQFPRFASVDRADSRCDAENFLVTKQGSIRGRVANFDGKDIENPWNPGPPQPFVTLFPLKDHATPDLSGPSMTAWAYRPNFEFFFPTVPAGNYVIAINPGNCPYPNNGMQRTFYPGISDISNAKVVTVKEGVQLVLPDFRALPTLARRSISGVVRYSDGMPAVGAFAVLSSADSFGCGSGQIRVKTDNQGNFRILGYESYKYRISASTDKFQPDGYRDRYSTFLDIPEKGDVAGLEIILPPRPL